MNTLRENSTRILRSVDEWNNWREREPSYSPDLTGTLFDNTPLHRANLRGCILRDAKFIEARVDDADFVGASLDRCIFVRVDLRRARGLNLAQLPDWLAFDAWTLNRSRGYIPKILLQRAGLDNDMASQFASPPQYHSCFVSYSSANSTFVDIVVDSLIRRGVEVWRDLKSLEPGVPLVSVLTQEAKKADFVLAVLSAQALESTWTSLEWFAAEKILPVTLDKEYQRRNHPAIQGLKVLSFENWKRGTVLEDGIELLLKRLRRSP